MNNDQITALAREYAEETVKKDEDMSNCLPNEYVRLFADAAEEVIRFLLRRYCLVKKDAVRKFFQSRNYILTHQDKYEVYLVRESKVEKRLLDCLFPDLGKEVEG